MQLYTHDHVISAIMTNRRLFFLFERSACLSYCWNVVIPCQPIFFEECTYTAANSSLRPNDDAFFTPLNMSKTLLKKQINTLWPLTHSFFDNYYYKLAISVILHQLNAYRKP